MKSCLTLLVGLALAQAFPIDEAVDEQWEIFKIQHGKVYSNQIEEKFRKMIFYENWLKISRHNEKYHKGEVSYGMAMNQFGDILHHERIAATKCLLERNPNSIGNGTRFILKRKLRVPSSVDWVKKGYVTDVKNQGTCGSCWSFGATGALEGQHKRKSGKLVSLSEQNLIDCSGKYGNQGCEGGVPDNAFQYIKENKGVDTEESYPYEGADAKCRFKSSGVGATDKGFAEIDEGSEKKLKEAVGTVGPVAIAIDASKESFQFYSDGVYDDPDCSSEAVNHAVLAVGYGTYDGKDFWLVKNSWGDGWGLQGYIRMSRNKDNQCGVATHAVYPLV